MRLGIVIAGANIAAISLVALAYGVLTNSPQVVGISLSGIMTGIAIAGAGASPPQGPSLALQYASKLLLNAITSIGEQLDLNNATLQVIISDPPLLVLSNEETLEHVDPGIGATSTTTYMAVPLSGVLEEVERLPSLNYIDLRNIATELITGSLGIGRIAEVEVNGDIVRVSIAGVPPELESLEAYPITPLTILIMALISKLAGSRVKLVKRGRTPEGYYWIVQLVG